MPKTTDRIILWIPTLQYLDGKPLESTPQNLQSALEQRGILYKQLFYRTNIAPTALPFLQEIVIDVDEVFEFSFGELRFVENNAHRGIYNLRESRFLVPVKLMKINKYPPDELAEYFKNCWGTSLTDIRE